MSANRTKGGVKSPASLTRSPGATRPAGGLKKLLTEVRNCRLCAADLPHEPRPVLRAASSAHVLIVGQAPGRKVHETGIPWNDPSGDRLRDWLSVDRDFFYDEKRIAIIPAGFCYPGKGPGGDLPPRALCAPTWHPRLRSFLPRLRLTILVGAYAQAYYLGDRRKASLTETVAAWEEYLPDYFPLPHPSPRNRNWFRRNDWFEAEVVPQLRLKFRQALEGR